MQVSLQVLKGHSQDPTGWCPGARRPLHRGGAFRRAGLALSPWTPKARAPHTALGPLQGVQRPWAGHSVPQVAVTGGYGLKQPLGDRKQ